MKYARRMNQRLVAGLAVLLPVALHTAVMAAPNKMVTLSGTLSCLGCDLKKEHGAAAQCKIYGHNHALKTKGGRYYTFLENGRSEALIKGEDKHNKKIRVYGTVFPGSQVMEVTNFRVVE